MDTNTYPRLEWSLWLNWVAATVIAFLINDGTQLFLTNGSILSFIYALLFDGFVIAFFQWLFVLRLRIPNSTQWILWGTLSWTAGWLLGKIGWLFANPVSATIVSLLIHGIIMGIVQWVFVVRKLYSKALFWVLVNSVGLLFSNGLSWFVIFPILLGNYSGWFSGPLDSAIRGAIFGTITGTTLIWLSRLARTEIDLAISNA